MEYIDKQRKDYLSWDEFFMGVAILASERSKDPNTQVGACIVSADNRILSVGYNGTPNGYEDRFFPWDREGDELNTKYMYVVHADSFLLSVVRETLASLNTSEIPFESFLFIQPSQFIYLAMANNVNINFFWRSFGRDSTTFNSFS